MSEEHRSIRLGDLAHARSGDKGNIANVGVVAREARGFEFLKAHLTEDAVAAFFEPLHVGTVRRHELPNLKAFNFVIDGALGGGASRSLRLDTQGKALATAILELRLPASLDDPPAEAEETTQCPNPS
jgi:hypothetical protein